MKVTADGQVTIPKDIRDHLGLGPDAEVAFEIDGDFVRLRKVAGPSPTRGQLLVEHMRGRLASRYTTDELMEFTRGPFTDLEHPDPGE